MMWKNREKDWYNAERRFIFATQARAKRIEWIEKINQRDMIEETQEGMTDINPQDSGLPSNNCFSYEESKQEISKTKMAQNESPASYLETTRYSTAGHEKSADKEDVDGFNVLSQKKMNYNTNNSTAIIDESPIKNSGKQK